MADSTVTDVSKMRVVDLRKELKSRGISSSGDKTELITRLQAAISHDSQDVNLDSDEIDSDCVLDEDDKSQNDILDDAVDTLNEELVLADQPPATAPEPAPAPAPTELPAGKAKPQRTLKRKITMTGPAKEQTAETKVAKNKESGSKKIILNRTTSVTSTVPKIVEEKVDDKSIKLKTSSSDDDKVKISPNLDPKARLELRAKRFGLPVKITEAQRKQARKNRFESNKAGATSVISNANIPVLADTLKKRAERFGQSVSKFMTDIENKEKLEKRRAKFGTVK